MMVDTCRVTRPSGSVFDRDTGQTVVTRATVYEGVCRVLRPGAGTRVVLTGESVTPIAPPVKVPYDVVGIEPGDRVEILTSQDPDLSGEFLWVKHIEQRTLESARVLNCGYDQ